jgi:hypothetical protein
MWNCEWMSTWDWYTLTFHHAWCLWIYNFRVWFWGWYLLSTREY